MGGLFILGTERHESRRIDNQLRGRAGRQGDPGESRFYLSLEDDIMRLFGSERVMGMMEKLGVDEDTPIDAKILSDAIENAQKQVESRNFQTRKNVLQYDDVMNTQREVIYKQRRQVLDGEDLQDSIQTMLHSMVENAIHGHMGEQKHMDAEAFREAVRPLPRPCSSSPASWSSPTRSFSSTTPRAWWTWSASKAQRGLRPARSRRSARPSCGSWSGCSCSGWWTSTGWTTSTP